MVPTSQIVLRLRSNVDKITVHTYVAHVSFCHSSTYDPFSNIRMGNSLKIFFFLISRKQDFWGPLGQNHGGSLFYPNSFPKHQNSVIRAFVSISIFACPNQNFWQESKERNLGFFPQEEDNSLQNSHPIFMLRKRGGEGINVTYRNETKQSD